VFGLNTFGDVTEDADGHRLSHAQTIRDVVEEGVLADQVGVDFFGIGEHHTDDFPMPAADVVLAAIAARTNDIHVGSAVTYSARMILFGCSSAIPRSMPFPVGGQR
jgi:alkanesulfonate monooxygenase SsuD/methylene tetrahydromethanopterin reductase-like flavin-dependent oxidoreductase (luciferase family)